MPFIRFIRNLLRLRSNDSRQYQSPYAQAVDDVRRALSLPNATNVLTDEETVALRNLTAEFNPAAISNFAYVGHHQRYLRELWEPELRIQREKEEAERRASEALGSVIRFSLASPEWYVGMTSDFTKAVSKIDRKLQGRILDAIAQITSAPVTPVGNTVKPLADDMKGMWRYRIGDYRLIYRPDETSKHILLLTFAARGGAYD